MLHLLMNCKFCLHALTPKHLCNKLSTYLILRPMFLNIYYNQTSKTYPELLKNICKHVHENNLFLLSSDPHNVIVEFLPYFYGEFDLF